jgi:hypothetical protein
MNKNQSIKFLKLYDASPEADLESLAEEAKGARKVEVSLAELSEAARKEVVQALRVKKEKAIIFSGVEVCPTLFKNSRTISVAVDSESPACLKVVNKLWMPSPSPTFLSRVP